MALETARTQSATEDQSTRCFANNSSNGCMAGFAHAAIDLLG